MPKNDKIPTDLVDDLRTQINKIGKLAPDLDNWLVSYSIAEGMPRDIDEPVLPITDEVQVHAAFAIMTAIDQMRASLRMLKGYAQEITDTKIERDKRAQDAFLNRIDP
jgi:hypothetical protein